MNQLLSNIIIITKTILVIVFSCSALKAQTTNTPPPQDVIPPTPQPLPVPDTTPSQPPTPEDVLPSPIAPTPSNKLPTTETIAVTEFEFTGNTVFSSEELTQQVLNKFIENNLVNNLDSKTFSLQELLQIAAEVARFYAEKGYSTSGAIVSIPEATRNQQRGIVNIKVIEGKLEEINVTGSRRLNRSYVKSRLGVSPDKTLNVNRLQEKLQLLSLNPLIKQISAQLSAGSRPGLSILDVEFKEAKSFDATLSLDNGRSPSVGSFQRQIFVREGNVTGNGDALSLGYSNTDGSNSFDTSYTLPINPQNGSLRFSFNTTDSNVIEPPFDDINQDGSGSDIESASSFYEISFRQPLSRRIKNRTFREFAIGLSGSLRDSETSLLNEPFSLSPGADDGETRVFALRLFQDWTQQNAKEVIAFRSQFSVGLDAFNSTVNKRIPETGEFVPDSRFFAWQGQGQWVRILAPQTLLLVRANAQLSDQGLLSSEQFTIGGLGSVRGYRQNQLLADNGVFASAEVQLPILRTGKNKSAPTGILQIIPFFDIGTAWNNSGIENADTSTLISLGMGLQWRNNNDFIARLDWGIPLTNVDLRDRTWQENGLLFSLQWNAF
ncbi:MAG: ShlB/FhaC/HecB family hemolysin secretion/activation protein [Rivularia sp. (in: Bacteria)]|nr:ShlB/FhaC/HecB family hemolysin secretion/activation protein [Rivularia sp. MS3]